MSTLRDDLLPVVNDARQLVDDLGMHQVRVIVRTRTWSSGRMNVGIPTVSDREIIPRPHVKGLVGNPILEVGPITPPFVGGGYTPAQLNPDDAPGVEYYWICIGPDGIERRYKPIKMTTARPFRYMFELQAIDRAMPF